MLLYEGGGESIKWFPSLVNDLNYKILDNKPIIFDSNFKKIQLDFTINLYKQITGQKANISLGKEALFTKKIINNILNLQNEK